jgi:acyl-CoA thioester hydrolase
MPSTSTTLRVRYAETDQMGVVYYANYFVWFEVARTDLLRTLGWTYREMEDSGVLLPVIEAHCEYRRPARYDDEIEIRTEGQLTSPVRMEFQYEVSVKGQAGLTASGHTAHAATGRDGRPCRLPERIRGVFA